MSAQCFASRRRPPARATQAVLVTLVCLLAAACASAPAPRPLAGGFAAVDAGVADPYADGKGHLDAGRYELAAQRFGEALAHDRRSLDALNGLGVAYTRLGRFDSARTQFERALQIDPTSALTLNNYGWSLLEQGRLREARSFLEQARRHATDVEAPVITANFQRLHRAPPPPLLAALDEDGAPQAPQQPRRLVRVDDNAWRLDTAGTPVEPLLRSDSTSAAPRSAAALQQHAAAPGPGQQPAQADGPAGPSAGAQSVAAATATVRSAPAGPGPDVARRPSRGGPIRLWPPRSEQTDAEADPIHAGDEA